MASRKKPTKQTDNDDRRFEDLIENLRKDYSPEEIQSGIKLAVARATTCTCWWFQPPYLARPVFTYNLSAQSFDIEVELKGTVRTEYPGLGFDRAEHRITCQIQIEVHESNVGSWTQAGTTGNDRQTNPRETVIQCPHGTRDHAVSFKKTITHPFDARKMAQSEPLLLEVFYRLEDEGCQNFVLENRTFVRLVPTVTPIGTPPPFPPVPPHPTYNVVTPEHQWAGLPVPPDGPPPPPPPVPPVPGPVPPGPGPGPGPVPPAPPDPVPPAPGGDQPGAPQPPAGTTVPFAPPPTQDEPPGSGSGV